MVFRNWNEIKKGILIDSGVEIFEKTEDADVKFELITD